MSRSSIIFLSAFLFLLSCEVPESIDIQWKVDIKTVDKNIRTIVSPEEIDIFPNCSKVNGVEHHFISIVIRNDFSIPVLNDEKEPIGQEIISVVYPEIANIYSYEGIGVVFENRTFVDSIEHNDFWSMAIETKNLEKLIRNE